jgi:hypothetical protein
MIATYVAKINAEIKNPKKGRKDCEPAVKLILSPQKEKLNNTVKGLTKS